jgi:hypothetical protein
MSAAHPLPFPEVDELDVQLVDEALLASLSREERALGEWARAEVDGGSARIVWAENVPAALEEIRRTKAGG